MALTPGSRLGPYEILSALGAGGMGEVYRARDTKLQREVALKVVSDGFDHDPDRVARFHREAHLLAALNHPHIAAIYGLEEINGAQCLILELVEGDTLADRLKAGPLPLTEAVTIARQVADALQAAHEKGIIHRDLKPSNIALTPDGQVKVLDFGLAKGISPTETGPSGAAGVGEGLPPDQTASPTITSPVMMTGVGVILGTAAYMAPEQAKGRAADKRCDVWAFGCVLYEMLTAKRAFDGEDVSDTLAAVLRGEPDWTALPADVSAPIRTLIRSCLEKDRKRRIGDISVALFVLGDPASVTPTTFGPGHSAMIAPRLPLLRRLVMPTAALIVGGAAVGTAVWLATRPTVPHVARFTLSSAGTAALSVDTQSRDLTITPGGTHIVYKGAGTTGAQLFVRALDQLEPAPLAGLGLSRAPFVSPDGQWIGFVETGTSTVTLKRVAITGGPALPICRLDGTSRGATWGVTTTASSLRQRSRQQASSVCRRPAVSRRS